MFLPSLPFRIFKDDIMRTLHHNETLVKWSSVFINAIHFEVLCGAIQNHPKYINCLHSYKLYTKKVKTVFTGLALNGIYSKRSFSLNSFHTYHISFSHTHTNTYMSCRQIHSHRKYEFLYLEPKKKKIICLLRISFCWWANFILIYFKLYF